jgi:hypothetical protein
VCWICPRKSWGLLLIASTIWKHGCRDEPDGARSVQFARRSISRFPFIDSYRFRRSRRLRTAPISKLEGCIFDTDRVRKTPTRRSRLPIRSTAHVLPSRDCSLHCWRTEPRSARTEKSPVSAFLRFSSDSGSVENRLMGRLPYTGADCPRESICMYILDIMQRNTRRAKSIKPTSNRKQTVQAGQGERYNYDH